MPIYSLKGQGWTSFSAIFLISGVFVANRAFTNEAWEVPRHYEDCL